MKRTALLLAVLLIAGCATVRRVYDPMDETVVRNAAIKAPVVTAVSPFLLFAETVATVFSGPPNLPGGDCAEADKADPANAYYNCLVEQSRYLNRKPSWRFARWLRDHVIGEGGTQGR